MKKELKCSAVSKLPRAALRGLVLPAHEEVWVLVVSGQHEADNETHYIKASLQEPRSPWTGCVCASLDVLAWVFGEHRVSPESFEPWTCLGMGLGL